MTAFTATTNQNFDELGFQFYTPLQNARTVLTSLNGQAWTASGNVFPAANLPTAWTGWATGDDLAVFVAANRTVSVLNGPATAPVANTTNALPTGTAWKKCIFGNNTFVSVNTSTTSAAYFAPRSGEGWTATTLPSGAAWSLLAFGNNTFVTVAPSSTSAARSTDNARTWGAVTLPASLTWADLQYANGYFVLVASGSRDVYTSPDGSTWTLQSTALPSTATWNKLAWIPGGTNGTWVAVASGSTSAAYSTDNGATWTASTLPASGTWIVGSGKAALDGRQMFFAISQATTVGAFSYNGITWTQVTIPTGTYGDIQVYQPRLVSGIDTITVNNGATLTVNTTQTRYPVGATALVITNGKLRIENTSTTVPIRFGTGRVSTTAVLSTIQAASGLATVEVAGNWIQVGTSNGTASQTFTSPYTTGDYIPVLEVETGNGTNVYEPWVNVTGAHPSTQFSYFRNGFRSVGSGDHGTCFTQDFNTTATQYLNLANCNAIADSNVIKCTSTTGLVPGTWITGRGLPATAVVQDVIDSTKFTINAIVPAGSTAPTTGFVDIPMIGVLPICSQYSTTLRFGDGTNGKIPVNGARIRVQNILITDYSSAAFNNAVYSSANAPAYFVTPAGGIFNFDTCLFGESYSNFLQAGRVTYNRVGGTYLPFISECYAVTITNSAFGLPPVNMVLGSPTALGATGSTNSTTTVTTPATNALIPGMLITGTNLHACTISSITNNTTITVSTAAFGTAGSIAFSYYGVWTMREHRMNLGNTAAAAASFTTALWSYVSNLTIDGLFLTFGGHAINGAGSNPSLGSAYSGLLNLQYSNNVSVNNLKGIMVGSYPKTRPYATAITPSVAGQNHTYSNLKLYNIAGVVGANAVNTINVSNITQKIGINNEGYNWASACRVFTDPANDAFLANDTKYWFKTRSYRTNNFADSTGYVDSMPMCGVMADPAFHKQLPQRMGAVPTWATALAPTVAYGNGVWVLLNGAVSGNTALVSEDDGATWTNYMMPVASATTQWWKVIWCPTQNYFMAIQGGTVTSTLVAYSTNGKDWSTVTTNPATAVYQAIAFDNSQATYKWMAISGGSAVSTVSSRASITTGSIVFGAPATTQIASAQWIDIATNGAGRWVAIAGGSAVGTATSYSTTGDVWTAGGVNASSLWQSVAYGNGTFCAISSSATNGPTACSADAVAWTAGTAPTLPTGMSYNKVIYTGTAFVLLAGPTPLTTGAPAAAQASQIYVVSTSNTATSVTWGSIKYLPDYTHWISMGNNGNAVGIVSTQTGKFAYTADITAGTPTWTLTSGVFPVWNRLSLYSQAQEYTTALATAAAVATTKDSATATCTSTAQMQVGTIMTLSAGNVVANGAAYWAAGTVGVHTSSVIITGITNATTFTMNKPALKTASGMTGTFYKHVYQVFRSTTSGFTARDNTTLIGTTSTATAGQVLFDDTFGVTAGTPYYYIIRKLSGGGAVNLSCSGTASASTITTAASFYNWQTSTEIEGKNGSNVLTSLFFNFLVQGIIPGCIVTGTGIPAGTTVTAVRDFDTIELSANLTSDVLSRGASRTVVGFSPAAGMYIYGSTVGMDAVVTSVDSATSMTVSVANTNTFTTQNLRFVPGYELPEIACIPSAPVVIQNNALQSTTLATTWTASGITATSAAVLCPLDNFVGINAGAPTATGSTLLATAANGTLTQSIQTGVGQSYTFSCYARARHPTISSYIQMKMDLGTTSETKTLTNQWARYSVSFTTTASTTNAVFTLPAMGTVVEVAAVHVTLGSTIPVPIPANTTTMTYFAPQQTLAATNGLAGWMMDGGAGIETTLNTAPTGQFYAHLHVGSTSSFTPTDLNQVYSTETTAAAADLLIGASTSAANITVDNLQPVSTKAPNHQILAVAQTGSTGITVKNSTLALNGTTGNLVNIPSGSAYNIYIHNIDLVNQRDYIAALYFDGAINNSSGTIKYQNIRTNRMGRNAWTAQSLDTSFKGAPGGNTLPAYNATSWNLSTATFNQDSIPIVNTSVYDSMFHEFTWGESGKGCLDLRMIGSTKASKPYTVTGGAPYFDNLGNLFFSTVSDQLVIEWPHIIKGITGFSKRMPHILGTDVGLNLVTSLGILVEYDLDKGSGYSGTWKQLNNTPGLNNLSAETGISALTGVRPKFRLSARYGLKYTGQTSQFVTGRTIQNSIINPTATATIVDDEVSGAATTGSLIVSNITGEWVTTNTIYSGTVNTTATATTNATATMPTSTITGTTLTVGTVSAGTVTAGMVLTGTGVTAGTYIISNISGAGAGSTWLVSKSQSVASTTITGTNNLVTLGTNTNMYIGMAVQLTGTTFGSVAAATTYYISEVIGSTQVALATSYANAIATTNLAVTTASGSMPLAEIHSTITATNTVGVFFPQPTSRITAIRLFTECDTDIANNYAFTTPTLSITGLKADSEVRVYRTSDGVELMGTESSGTSFTATYEYSSDTEVFIVIHALSWIPIRLEGQILGANGLSLLVQQQRDRQYFNP